MFGGFPSSALHWMNPGTHPLSFMLQLFPREMLFRAMGYFSIVFVSLAWWTSFLYFHDLVRSRFIAAVGGLCYGLSVISLHRISQLDNAHMTIVLLPLIFLAARRDTQ